MDKKEVVEGLKNIKRHLDYVHDTVINDAIKHLESEPFDVLIHLNEGGSITRNSKDGYFKLKDENTLAKYRPDNEFLSNCSVGVLFFKDFEPYEPEPPLEDGVEYIVFVSCLYGPKLKFKGSATYQTGNENGSFWRDYNGDVIMEDWTVEPVRNDDGSYKRVEV